MKKDLNAIAIYFRTEKDKMIGKVMWSEKYDTKPEVFLTDSVEEALNKVKELYNK